MNKIKLPVEAYGKYYGDKRIKEMLRFQFKDSEFCVGRGPKLINDGWTFPVKVVPQRHFDVLVEEGLDLFFPIRDKEDRWLTIVWDLEYFNRDSSSWLYENFGQNQKLVFGNISKIFDKVITLLNSFGIRYVVDTTASGFHVLSRIETSSKTFEDFANEGVIEESLAEKYDTTTDDIKRQRKVPHSLGRAYNTAGKILEYFTHLITEKIKDIECTDTMPFTIGDTSQGGSDWPRSGFSSDLTQYAHPIYMRVIRAVGSFHQKVLEIFPTASPAVDIMKIPGLSYEEILEIMWDIDRAREFYIGKDVSIPISNEGWASALSAYKSSETRALHREFERMPLRKIESAPIEHPPCVQQNIHKDKANPLLLTPTNLQFIFEYFDQIGESVREVARIIAKYYSNANYKWYDPNTLTGIDFQKYDAQCAANFWARAYWTLKRLGLGRGLSCERIQRAGICPVFNCGFDLSSLL